MLIIALVLAAVGGAALVAARTERMSLLALAAQWSGLVIACGAQDPTATNALYLGRESAVELITAAASLAILWLTLRSINIYITHYALRITHYALPTASVLLGGLAGVGFAYLFPLGAPETDLVLYWTLMAGTLALVLDGTRSPVKLTAGLLALLNAMCLLVYTLNLTPPGVALLGLMAATRLGMALLLAYGWLLVVRFSGDLSFDPVFTARDGSPTEVTALQPRLPTPDTQHPIPSTQHPVPIEQGPPPQ